jgi:hypothetical protein
MKRKVTGIFYKGVKKDGSVVYGTNCKFGIVDGYIDISAAGYYSRIRVEPNSIQRVQGEEIKAAKEFIEHEFNQKEAKE